MTNNVVLSTSSKFTYPQWIRKTPVRSAVILRNARKVANKEADKYYKNIHYLFNGFFNNYLVTFSCEIPGRLFI